MAAFQVRHPTTMAAFHHLNREPGHPATAPQTKSTLAGSKYGLLFYFMTDKNFRGSARANLEGSRKDASLKAGTSCLIRGSTVIPGYAIHENLESGATFRGTRYPAAEYPTIKVNGYSYKAGWICWVVDKYEELKIGDDKSDDLMKTFLEKEVSHLCGDRGCIAKDHHTVEDADENASRIFCHANKQQTHKCPHQEPCIISPMVKRTPEGKKRKKKK